MVERYQPQAVFRGRKKVKRRSLASSPLIWGAVVVAIGIGTLLMSGTRRPPVVSSEQEIEAPVVSSEPQVTAPVAPEAPKAEPDPVTTESEGASAQRSGEGARQLIAEMREGRAKMDLESIDQRAGELLAEGEIADAYLLYFFGARQGHARSAFALGALYDPRYYSKERSLVGRPDPLQAGKWYHIAAKGGHNEARTRLLGLQDWVETRAQSGDSEAQRILLSWQ